MRLSHVSLSTRGINASRKPPSPWPDRSKFDSATDPRTCRDTTTINDTRLILATKVMSGNNVNNSGEDSDGSDVFLDLAQSDEETEHATPFRPTPSMSNRPVEHSAGDDPLSTIEFAPSIRHSQLDNARPRSSGLQSRISTTQDSTSWSSRHSRHASQPMNSTSYLSNLATSRSGLNSASNRAGFGRFADPSVGPGYRISETPRLRRTRDMWVDAEEYTDTQPARTNGINARYTPKHFSVHLEDVAQASPSSNTNQSFPNDSDSADSVTAASTVWDELDELKSRIRKLESSGRPPRSSSNNVRDGNGQGRPQTATTAPTTVSSSPRNTRKQSAMVQDASSSSNVPSDIHPTLQSALARAKTSLKPHIYRPLEAAINDSLLLAMTSGRQNPSAATSTAASTVNGSSTTDRQLKRKVDNLCRNLTDLCIAVCDTRSEDLQVASSPINSHRTNQTSPVHYREQGIDSRDDAVSQFGSQSRRESLSWVRLDDYRAARGLNTNDRPELVEENQYRTERSPDPAPRDYAARYSSLGRPENPNAAKRMSRTDFSVVGSPEIERAPSRAMTELDGRSSLTSRFDHLKLSSGSQRSPSLRQTLEARRRSAHIREDDLGMMADTQSAVGLSTAHTPATRRFLDRVRGGAGSEVGSSTSSMARKRLSSHEGSYASPRVSTPLARATSLSMRRYEREQ